MLSKGILLVVLSALMVFSAEAFFDTPKEPVILKQLKNIPASREAISLSFSPVVKKVSPAVVNIYTKKKVQVRSSLSPLFGDPLFEQFFGGNAGGVIREKVVRSLGSGVLVSARGLVVTSQHVVDGSDEIVVLTSDKNEYSATLVLQDKSSDLAILQLAGKHVFPFIPLVDSDQLEVGDLVLAVGNPFGVGQTVTSGIISALARSAKGVSDYQFFIQTDAAINPGNSGGALVNMKGELAGVNTAIYSRSGGSNGIGFAIPANMVATLIRAANAPEQLGQNTNKNLLKPWLGAEYQNITVDIAESLGLETPEGVLIRKIYDASPSSSAGLMVGDIIIAFDGKSIDTISALKFRVAVAEVGSKRSITILRNGSKLTKKIMTAYPSGKKDNDAIKLSGNHPLTGLLIKNMSPRLSRELGVDADSTAVVIYDGANRFGFQKGDIILAVNRQKILSAKQLNALMIANQRAWEITYARDGRITKVTVRF